MIARGTDNLKITKSIFKHLLSLQPGLESNRVETVLDRVFSAFNSKHSRLLEYHDFSLIMDLVTLESQECRSRCTVRLFSFS
jgi:hypothetical protein